MACHSGVHADLLLGSTTAHMSRCTATVQVPSVACWRACLRAAGGLLNLAYCMMRALRHAVHAFCVLHCVALAASKKHGLQEKILTAYI
jgi:hypothetical protein